MVWLFWNTLVVPLFQIVDKNKILKNISLEICFRNQKPKFKLIYFCITQVLLIFQIYILEINFRVLPHSAR